MHRHNTRHKATGQRVEKAFDHKRQIASEAEARQPAHNGRPRQGHHAPGHARKRMPRSKGGEPPSPARVP